MSPARWITAVGSLTSHPAALLLLSSTECSGFCLSRAHSTGLIVWTMTLFIQRADRRDTLAIHAKLDELLKATREARTELGSIDEREPEAIEKLRNRERREVETR